MRIWNDWERIVKLNNYDEQRKQPLHPSSIIELTSFLRILLSLKMFKAFADVKSGGNFRHNLGPRYLKECLRDVTRMFWKLFTDRYERLILQNIRSISGDDCFTFQFAALCERVLTNTTLLMDTLEGKLRIQLRVGNFQVREQSTCLTCRDWWYLQ